MSGRSRTVIQARLKLPAPLATRVRAMAIEREMELDDLLAELVLVGEMGLRKEEVPSQHCPPDRHPYEGFPDTKV